MKRALLWLFFFILAGESIVYAMDGAADSNDLVVQKGPDCNDTFIDEDELDIGFGVALLLSDLSGGPGGALVVALVLGAADWLFGSV